MLKVKDLIDKNGYTIIGVGGQFFYTIGMSKQGLPDLFIDATTGYNAALLILEATYRKWRRTGAIYGVTSDAISTDNPPEAYYFVEQVTKKKALKSAFADYAFQAQLFYKKHPEYVGVNGVQLAQVFLADKGGKFPIDEGYDSEAFPQPILSRGE